MKPINEIDLDKSPACNPTGSSPRQSWWQRLLSWLARGPVREAARPRACPS